MACPSLSNPASRRGRHGITVGSPAAAAASIISCGLGSLCMQQPTHDASWLSGDRTGPAWGTVLPAAATMPPRLCSPILQQQLAQFSVVTMLRSQDIFLRADL